MAGASLPVEPLRRQLVPTEPFDQLPQRFPMVIDMSTGFHFRPEGLGLLMAWADPEEKSSFNTNFDRAFVEKILTRGVSRFPVLEEASLQLVGDADVERAVLARHDVDPKLPHNLGCRESSDPIPSSRGAERSERRGIPRANGRIAFSDGIPRCARDDRLVGGLVPRPSSRGA